MHQLRAPRLPVSRPILGIIAAVALLIGLGGAAVVAGGQASAQTATATATRTATAGASVTAPATGTGVAESGGTSYVAPFIILGVLVVGGGVVLAVLSRRQI